MRNPSDECRNSRASTDHRLKRCDVAGRLRGDEKAETQERLPGRILREISNKSRCLCCYLYAWQERGRDCQNATGIDSSVFFGSYLSHLFETDLEHRVWVSMQFTTACLFVLVLLTGGFAIKSLVLPLLTCSGLSSLYFRKGAELSFTG